MWLYWLGFIVHVIFIFSVSDIFFKNFLGVGGWKCNERNGPARRVVFVLAEGLEMDQLTERTDGKVAEAMHGKGSWGTTDCTIPESSYSGNIALLSGFPVDPVTTFFGRYYFKADPIDNIMNRSKEAFYFGSKDVYDYIYNEDFKVWWTSFYPEMESSLLPNVSLTLLDNLILNKVINLLSLSKIDSNLNRKLNSDKTLFLIHYNGINKADQLFGKYSAATNKSVNSLFNSIDSVVNTLEYYFKNDKKTTYLLFSNVASKYGNGDKRSSAKPIRYPFVAWGAGISSSKITYKIHQLDVAALVSALLGLDLPFNSRGTIPETVLNMEEDFYAEAHACNAMQLSSLVIESESRLPFKVSTDTIKKMRNALQEFTNNKTYAASNRTATELITLSLSRMKHIESLFKHLIWFSFIFLSVCWIILIATELLPDTKILLNTSLMSLSEWKIKISSQLNNFNQQMCAIIRNKMIPSYTRRIEYKTDNQQTGENLNPINLQNDSNQLSRSVELDVANDIENELIDMHRESMKWIWMRNITDIMFFIFICLVFFVLLIIKWPVKIVVYTTAPILVSWLLSYTSIKWIVFTKERNSDIWKQITMYSSLYLLTSWLLVKAFQYDLELGFGIMMMALSSVYIKKSSWSILIIWLVSGLLMLMFANKRAEIVPRDPTILLPSVVALILWNVYATFRTNPRGIDFLVTATLLWQCVMSLGCIVFTESIHSSGYNTPNILKSSCWILVLSIFGPSIHGKNHSTIILNICMALSIPYILLSTTSEPVFFLLLSNFMITWMLLEGFTDQGMPERGIKGEDARRALMYVYFCFFTTEALGNSYNFVSSNLYWVLNFTENLIEPKVTLIILLKHLVIYTMITSIFLIICASNGLKGNKGFHLVLLLFQLIGAHLFCSIKLDEDGTLQSASANNAIAYLTFNVFILIQIFIVLFCKHIYSVPMSKTP